MLLLAQASVANKEPLTGYDAVAAGDGIAITVTGLLIVFVALSTISLFIGALPKLLELLGPYLPKIESHHDQQPSVGRKAAGANSGAVDPRLVAAIGWAVHATRQSEH